MKILAIDSSGLVASAAVLDDDILIAEYTINYKKTHSQTLLPMLDEIKKTVELDLDTIDAIAVSSGPGSFTGLRIGSATAKGLGLALDKPIIPVPTLDAMAYNLYGSGALICPMMDARRNQVYTGLYKFERETSGGYKLRIIEKQCVVSVEHIISLVNMQGMETIILGDAIPVYEDSIRKQLTAPYCFAPAGHNRQRAAAVGMLAMELYKNGIIQTADEHAPEYLRLSQAERERREKQNGND